MYILYLSVLFKFYFFSCRFAFAWIRMGLLDSSLIIFRNNRFITWVIFFFFSFCLAAFKENLYINSRRRQPKIALCKIAFSLGSPFNYWRANDERAYLMLPLKQTFRCDVRYELEINALRIMYWLEICMFRFRCFWKTEYRTNEIVEGVLYTGP